MTSTSQTPSEILNYTAQIDPSNQDTITSAAWSIRPYGPTVSAPTNTSTTTSVLLSELVANTEYYLTCLITGASGQIYTGSMVVNGVPYR